MVVLIIIMIFLVVIATLLCSAAGELKNLSIEFDEKELLEQEEYLKKYAKRKENKKNNEKNDSVGR